MLWKVKAMLKYTIESKTPDSHKQLKVSKAAEPIWKLLDSMQSYTCIIMVHHSNVAFYKMCLSVVATMISIMILFILEQLLQIGS